MSIMIFTIPEKNTQLVLSITAKNLIKESELNERLKRKFSHQMHRVFPQKNMRLDFLNS